MLPARTETTIAGFERLYELIGMALLSAMLGVTGINVAHAQQVRRNPAYQDIISFADSYCGPEPTRDAPSTGTIVQTRTAAGVDVDVKGLLQRFASLGINAATEKNAQTYTGLLQQDVGVDLQNRRTCRDHVLTLFSEGFHVTKSSITFSKVYELKIVSILDSDLPPPIDGTWPCGSPDPRPPEAYELNGLKVCLRGLRAAGQGSVPGLAMLRVYSGGAEHVDVEVPIKSTVEAQTTRCSRIKLTVDSALASFVPSRMYSPWIAKMKWGDDWFNCQPTQGSQYGCEASVLVEATCGVER